jgi:hypothetical protein
VRGKVPIGAAAATTLSFPAAVEAAFPGRDGLIAFAREVGGKRLRSMSYVRTAAGCDG